MRPGAPYPVYDVLAAVVPLAGAELLEVTLRDPLAVEALALRGGAGSWSWWRTSPRTVPVDVALPSGASQSSIWGHTQQRASTAPDATLARRELDCGSEANLLRLAGGGRGVRQVTGGGDQIRGEFEKALADLKT